MKFYKRKNLDQVRPKDEGFYQSIAGDLITNSTSSMQLPSGTMASRPIRLENGIIRYNQDLKELEAFIDGTWERIRTVRPSEIVVQDFGAGDYEQTVFYPLDRNYKESYKKGAANVLVYVDNVYQIPIVNYQILAGGVTEFVNSSNDILEGSTTLELTLGSVFDPTNYSIKVSNTEPLNIQSYIQSNTIITAYDAITRTVTLSKPTTGGTIPANTSLSIFDTESYILSFNEPPPNKNIRVILGYDGYFPPLVTI